MHGVAGTPLAGTVPTRQLMGLIALDLQRMGADLLACDMPRWLFDA